MLGLIGPSVEAVAVEVRPERLIVHFALERLSDAEREDVEDVLGDLDALLDRKTSPATGSSPPTGQSNQRCMSDPPMRAGPGCWHRRVFERKRRD
jgi:hypothetical protein